MSAHESAAAWLVLAMAPGIRTPLLGSWLTRYGSAPAVLQAARGGELRDADAATLEALRRPDSTALGHGLAWLGHSGHGLLGWDDPRYPTLLRHIDDPPPVLFVDGDAEILGLPQLAVVGSRNATPTGRDIARDFAAFLARSGFAITSGLAEGIDAAAHTGALTAGGRTIAVCGTGLDLIYPRRHAALAAEIIAGGGALVSEFVPGTPVRRANFPQRNRIISGLAVGTLVVEASLASGALITARCAARQGREVFAIPGSIHNPLTRGCHRLIREGAKLVESARDIIDELGGALAGLQADLSLPQAGAPPAADVDTDYQRLLESMAFDPVDADTLVARCGLTIGEVSSMLLILELQGLVRSLSGGRYQRVTRSVDP